MNITPLNTFIEKFGSNFFPVRKNIPAPDIVRENESFSSPVNPEYYHKLCSINQKRILSTSNTIRDTLFQTFDDISNQISDFCKMKIKNSNFRFNLKYPRDKFMSDVYVAVKNLSASERQIVWNYFGFEVSKDSLLKMSGFPSMPENSYTDLNGNINEAIKALEPLVDEFVNHNEIVPDGENVTEKAAGDINVILNSFPELYSIIGKKQHYSHDFTLDVHTFAVLQECIKNPDFEKLNISEKRILMLAAIFHDIEKAENIPDSKHPAKSANSSVLLLDRINASDVEKDNVYRLIKNHNLLEQCNKADVKTKQRMLNYYASELKNEKLLEMEKILTKSDLLSTKENNKSFYKYQDAYNSVFCMLFVDRVKFQS